MQLLNIFHSGLMPVILLMLVGTIACYVGAGVSAKKAGASITQSPFFIWAIVMTILTIAVIIWIASDYKGV